MGRHALTTPIAAREDRGREFAFTPDDFAAIAGKVQARTGIVLGATKRDLVYGRLGRRLRALGCTGFDQYRVAPG